MKVITEEDSEVAGILVNKYEAQIIARLLDDCIQWTNLDKRISTFENMREAHSLLREFSERDSGCLPLYVDFDQDKVIYTFGVKD